MDQQNQNLFDLHMDQQSFNYFGEAAKWAKFIAIIGFVFCGLMVVVALFAGTIFASMFSAMGSTGMGMVGGGAFTVVYLIFAALWFFPCLYLFRFATQMQSAIQSNEQNKLQLSIRNLKSYFRFLGILFIVILSFYALGILGALAMGLGSM
jgi:hypothetical protein